MKYIKFVDFSPNFNSTDSSENIYTNSTNILIINHYIFHMECESLR